MNKSEISKPTFVEKGKISGQAEIPWEIDKVISRWQGSCWNLIDFFVKIVPSHKFSLKENY